MRHSSSPKRQPPKRVLALSDLEQTKTAVLNSLTTVSGQRTYEHAIREFVAWYCSEPRLRSIGRSSLDGVAKLASSPPSVPIGRCARRAASSSTTSLRDLSFNVALSQQPGCSNA